MKATKENLYSKMNQTDTTSDILNIAEKFTGNDTERIKAILHWLKTNLKLKPRFAKKRSRTASEILESKTVTGCIDYAIAFLGIILALHLKGTFVDCVEKNWLTEKTTKSSIKGHTFCRITLAHKELIVDPTNGIINETGQFLVGTTEYVPLKEGLDSWDIGFMNNGDQLRFLETNFNVQFNNK